MGAWTLCLQIHPQLRRDFQPRHRRPDDSPRLRRRQDDYLHQRRHPVDCQRRLRHLADC
jgi:hypothetical protein